MNLFTYKEFRAIITRTFNTYTSKTNIDSQLFKWSSHPNDQLFWNIPPVYFSAFYAKRLLRGDKTRNIRLRAELENYFPTTQTSDSVQLLPLLFLFYFCETLLQSTGSVHVKYAEHNLKLFLLSLCL